MLQIWHGPMTNGGTNHHYFAEWASICKFSHSLVNWLRSLFIYWTPEVVLYTVSSRLASELPFASVSLTNGTEELAFFTLLTRPNFHHCRKYTAKVLRV